MPHRFTALAILAFASLLSAASASRGAEAPPAYAYPVNPPGFKPKADNGAPRRVPDSDATYSFATVFSDRFTAPDWHPQDHPPMPDVVAKGRKPDVFACGYCHRADGSGGPENSSLAGLPEAYIIRQMADFKNGVRNSAVPERAPMKLMISIAKAASDAEIAAAAAYFAALKPKPNIRVVETDTVPRSSVAGWFFVDSNTGEKEPVGQRIIEVPENLDQFENRDSRARFIVYAPLGSLQKGAAFVTTGGGKTQACAKCHGDNLEGLQLVPAIAGRSPSYIIRQLYDFRSGARAGDNSALMQGVVANLDQDDMVSIAAYLSSLRQ